MTADDVIAQFFRERGCSEEQINYFRAGADAAGVAAHFGQKTLSVKQAEVLRQVMTLLTSLSVEEIHSLHKHAVANARREAEAN